MMSDSDYTIRNYRSGDLEDCAHLWLLEGQDQTGHYISPQIVKERLKKPGFSTEETVLTAEKDGNIIGCLNMIPELATKRAFIHCIVHPQYRRHGISTTLLEKAAKPLIDMGVALAHVDILESNTAASSLLLKLGFKVVRQSIHMQQTLKAEPFKTVDSHLYIRHLTQNEEAMLSDLQNRTFADHWGYSPNTVEDITFRLNQPNNSYRHVILALYDDKPIGYCWTTTIPEPNPETGKRHGSIYMLGVDSDYRNRGVGRAVLVAGLISLFAKGVEVVEITADSVNEQALALYKSVGFRQQAVSQIYEKVLV
jgi:mycothiol synthase